MKTNPLALFSLGVALILVGLPVQTRGAAKVSDQAKSILKQIHDHHTQLTAAVKSKNLESAHEHADSIQELSDALKDEAGQELKTGVEKFVLVINQVHDDAEGGNQAATETSLKKLDGALQDLETQFGVGKKEQPKISEKAKGILKQIHERHAELTAAVKSKSLEAAHEHADTLDDLSTELSDEVVQDQKAAVEKFSTAVSDIHDVAESGNQPATEASLKKLDAALQELDARLGLKKKEPAKLSDKAKGILKQVREHQAGLGAAVKSKNLEAAHEHADSIQESLAELADAVGPEHQTKVEKLIAAINELHDSAENGNQSGTESSLKKFDGLLKEFDDAPAK